MKRAITVLLLVCMIFCAVACADGEETARTIDLIENGASEYTIVLPDEASETEQYAADELADFVEQATGVKLMQAKSGDFTGTKYISVGKTEQLENAGVFVDASRLNYDGFFIKTAGDAIFIDGASERSCMYGVYELLERYFGIRFLTQDCTYIPEQKDVRFEAPDVVCKPAFRFRTYFSGAGYNGDAAFYARSKMYSGEAREVPGYVGQWYQNAYGGAGHNSLDYVPKDVYGEEHPEFYASTTNAYLAGSGMDDICYSNGVTQEGELDETMDISVAKIVLDALKRYATENEECTFFFIGIADHMGGGCRCETCKAREAEAEGIRSATVVPFINLMAREMKAWAAENYPGREMNIGFFAYYWTEQPPVRIRSDGTAEPLEEKFALEDNVYVRFAPLKANGAYALNDERQDKSFTNNIRYWSDLTENLMIWDYVCDFGDYLRYFPDLNYYANNLKFYEELKVKYVFNQSSWTSQEDWQGKLKFYIASKLFWDTGRNVEELIDEFLTLYHGETAAPYIRSYMEIMENHFAYLRNYQNLDIDYTSTTNTYHGYEYYPLTMLENCVDLLEQAIQAIAADGSLTAEEKEIYTQRMSGVIVTPLGMILRDYSNYFADNTGKQAYVNQFLDHITIAGISSMGESITLNKYLTKYGIV